MTDKTKDFLQKLKDSGHWNDDYDYSKVDYLHSKDKVIIIDKKFNTEHLLTPNELLRRGTSCCSRNLRNGYISYDELKGIVRSIDIKSQDQYITWFRYGQSHEIPSKPDRVYKNNGWVSWLDFLGNNEETIRGIALETRRTNAPKLDFESAKNVIRRLNLDSNTKWREAIKLDIIPNNIPKTPEKYYSEWVSWDDFLGNKNKKDIKPYEEAKKIARTLNITNFKEWTTLAKTDNLPIELPFNPADHYKDSGWVDYFDFFGEQYQGRALKVKPFLDAREFATSLGLKSQQEWYEWAKHNRPNDIPFSPNRCVEYKYDWISWANWLGYLGNGKHQWSKQYIIDFIKSLENELNNLDSVELITIINSNNLSKKLRELGNLENLVSTQAGSEERANLVRSIIEQLEDIDEEDVVATTETQENNTEFEEVLQVGSVSEVTEEVTETELQPLNPIQELHMYDNTMITASLDDENIDFLLKNQLKKLWNKVLNNKVDIESFRNETGGDKFTIVKNWFFNEYEEVVRIESPSDYIFKHQPNLMQKLITYRLINEKRYGNWSGTGAGKTLSAIFAGRYAGAKNTLIICNNATVEGWVNSIDEYFTNNRIYTKRWLGDDTDLNLYSIVDKYDVNFVEGENNYLILNYETFQLEDGEYIVSELLKNNRIDYIILDEVQNVKQRDDEESTRRNVVSKLIIHSKEKNEDLLVLAMSATPVINNLTEPKKLIELLTGELHDELSTTESIINGIEMYKALTRHGLRYKPSYGISVNEEIIELDGQHLAEKIIRIPRGAVVDFERVLIETKLDGVKSKIKRGTLIYTHYVTELSHLIGDYVKNLGFSVGYYTGEDKSGLKLFKDKKIDVLIGSAPVGTGVDGIQKVCNTLIPIVLPWTSSEYDQLVGRIDRQGSHFDHVNIYIPQVIIPTGDNIWSWDRRRHNIIRFKATLADLAVDGRVPRNLLPSKTELIEEAKKELTDWVNRLQEGDYITFEREEMVIPLNPRLFERNRTQLGDFSELNQRWSVTRSDNTHDRLVKDPSEWYYYHTLYSEKRKTWSEIPYIEISKKINVRPDWIVGDFGCGENLLSKEIKNKVYAFDHVAIDDKVYACDIKNVPIEDGVLDVAVFSLSLMGSNYTEYFKEAYRTLKMYGNIFVCEPASKWEGREEELKACIESVGFKCFGTVKNTDKFIYIDGIKY